MNKILVVDDGTGISKALIKMLLEVEPYILHAGRYLEDMPVANYTPERDHGWYRKFEKNSKKRNLK